MGWPNHQSKQKVRYAQCKAGLLKEMGKQDESEKLMADALTIANEAEVNIYG